MRWFRTLGIILAAAGTFYLVVHMLQERGTLPFWSLLLYSSILVGKLWLAGAFFWWLGSRPERCQYCHRKSISVRAASCPYCGMKVLS